MVSCRGWLHLSLHSRPYSLQAQLCLRSTSKTAIQEGRYRSLRIMATQQPSKAEYDQHWHTAWQKGVPPGQVNLSVVYISSMNFHCAAHLTYRTTYAFGPTEMGRREVRTSLFTISGHRLSFSRGQDCIRARLWVSCSTAELQAV